MTDRTQLPGSAVTLREERTWPDEQAESIAQTRSDEEGKPATELFDGADDDDLGAPGDQREADAGLAPDGGGAATPGPDAGVAAIGASESPRAEPQPAEPQQLVHPRLWQRRLAVLSDAGRKRLRWVVASVAVLAVLCVSLVLLHTPLLAVRHVAVHGAQHTGAAAVLAAAGLADDPPLIDVNPAQASAAIERLPWVRHAVVVRRWPDSVVVEVTERTPVGAFAVPGGQVALVDAGGRVLAREPGTPSGPALFGPVAPGPPGTAVSGADAPAVTVAATLPEAIAARVTSVTVDRAGDVTLWLGTGVQARLGSASELRAKLVALQSVMAGASVPRNSEIDVTVPDAPTVGPLPPGAHPPVVGR